MTRIGYLTSEYPAISHTFIRREVEALRQMGVEIETFSIKPTLMDHAVNGSAENATQAVLGRGAMSYFAACLHALASNPRSFCSTLVVALKHRVPGLRALIWSLFHFIEAMMMIKLARRAGISRLHNHFANSGATVGMLAAHYLQMPWSMTLHGISETNYPAGLLLADKIARAEFVACASYFMRAQAMRETPPEQWTKFHIVRCSVDLAALPLPLAAVQCGTTFVCVGRLSAEKGHHGLLDAFAAISAVRPELHLRLVGDGPCAGQLAGYASTLGIADRVTFLGALDEAAALAEIARADVLVLASFMEGLPVVLIEALALGKVVVASRVAGIPELVEDGVSGMLFNPSDWAGLADAMSRLADDAELRTLMGQAGKLRVKNEFAAPIAAAPLVSLFERKVDHAC